MSDLPDGWGRESFGTVFSLKYGKALAVTSRDPEGQYPVYGSAGVMTRTNSVLATSAAVIIGRKGNVGQSWLTDGPSWPIDTTYYASIPDSLNPVFLLYQLESLHLRRLDSSTTTPSLRRQDLEAQSLVIPPLDEQRRIVAILEDHFAHLDAAGEALLKASNRAAALTKQVLLEAIPEPEGYPPTWRLTEVGRAGHVELGRQRHPDWHTGSNIRPYLRVANVFEDRLDLSDVMEMHWPADTFERFRLHPGDVLLNEGQSPHLLGRPAIYRGTPSAVAFTNSLLRFQAEGVQPEFALLVFRRHMHAGRFTRESRITTNIAHLSAGRLKTVEFPIPPMAEQQRLVAEVKEKLNGAQRLVDHIDAVAGRTQALRRSLLRAAFRGDLTRDFRRGSQHAV